MIAPLTKAQFPELIFGLIAPIGVDLNLLSDALGQVLDEMGYQAHAFRLTSLMKEVKIKPPIARSSGSTVASYQQRIAHANAIRAELGDDAMAALAVSAIRAFRAQERSAKQGREAKVAAEVAGGERDEELPLPAQAYIVRQLKRPEEVDLLRGVYGRQFILVGAYAPQEIRLRHLKDRERSSRGGLLSDVDAHNLAYNLIAQDAKESLDRHGQNVRDAFPLADVFIDTTSKQMCRISLGK